ncbi:MAG: SDR family oxidoreductase [Pseudomonadales bacterium]|nr:SDR family oxidoreductase [Pseudomonadales bacterium]
MPAPVDPYGQSKWRAECQLREACENGPMPVVIVRPALVYGARPRATWRCWPAVCGRGCRGRRPAVPAP